MYQINEPDSFMAIWDYLIVIFFFLGIQFAGRAKNISVYKSIYDNIYWNCIIR